MNFRQEDALLLFAVLLVLAAWEGWRAWRRQRSVAVLAPAARKLVGGVSSEGLGRWRALLRYAAYATLILAFAGPLFGERTRTLRRRGVDIVVALDFSKSMLARDVQPSRIERAKAELRSLLEESSGDRIGLVAFAGETLQFPMTFDGEALGLFLRDLGPQDMPVGGTAIGKALIASKRLLLSADAGGLASGAAADNSAGAGLVATSSSEARSRVVILMTDGEDHEGDPVEAAGELADAGVRVYPVGIGSRSGEPIPTSTTDGAWAGYLRDAEGKVVTTRLTAQNERVLKQVAELTGGTYTRARKGTVGMASIRRALRSLKQGEEKARRVTVQEDRYPLPLALAFLLLVLEMLLPQRWLRRGAWGRASAGALGSVLLLSLGFLLGSLLAPSPARAWSLLESRDSDVRAGNARLRNKDSKGALKAYDRAAKTLPDDPRVQFNRGLALLAQGKHEEARKAFGAASEPPAGAALRGKAHYHEGLSYLQEGDALAAKIPPSRPEPGQATPQPEVASLQALEDAYKAAVGALTMSLRTQPGNADAAWNLELAQRRYAQAKQRRQQRQEAVRSEQQEHDKQGQGEAQDQPGEPQDPAESQGGDEAGNADESEPGDRSDEPQEADDGQQAGQNPGGPSSSNDTTAKPGAGPDRQGKPSQGGGQDQAEGKGGQGGTKPRPSQGGASGDGALPPGGSQGSQTGGQRPLPDDARRLLDALEQNEKSFAGERIRGRSQGRRRVEKDW